MKRGKPKKIKQKNRSEILIVATVVSARCLLLPCRNQPLRLHRFNEGSSCCTAAYTEPTLCRLIFRTAPQMFHVKQPTPRVFRITALFHVKHFPQTQFHQTKKAPLGKGGFALAVGNYSAFLLLPTCSPSPFITNQSVAARLFAALCAFPSG